MGNKKELLYDGKYYDVTNWIKKHPGGKIIEIYTSTGEDSTPAVQQFHQRSTNRVMTIMKFLPHRNATDEDHIEKMDTEKAKRHKVLTEDFLALFKQLKAEGLFEPDLLHVILRLLEILFLFFLGSYLLRLQPGNILVRIAGVFISALAYGRSGWVQHEGGHHSLTGIPRVDQIIQSVLLGLLYGTSGAWWNSQHSRHHAMAQHLKHDVDLQTLPLLAFNSKVAKNPGDGKGFFVQNQKWLFLFCDTLLVTLSWGLIIHPRYCLHKKKYFDLFCMGLHYPLIYYNLGFVNSIFVTFLTSMYLFGNFSLSHTHLPVTDEPTHWVEYSLCHTANIRSSWWVDYWMGYLNYQIEHHLFPTMPQYRNKLCRDRVKALAKKHNLPYHLFSYREGVEKTFENLDSVSKELASN